MATYFSAHSLAFLRALARHNDRAWFLAHKPAYEAHVREPFQALLTDLQPDLMAVSPQFRSEPRAVGGSLFRIQRDTRFANDKTPYKTWQGARLFHARCRELPAPSFYLQLEPGRSFLAAGIWHPDTPVQRRIRQFIVDNPAGWRSAAHAPSFRRRFALRDDDRLVRVPPGYPDDFAHRDDLRLRTFAAARAIDDDAMTGPRLRQLLARDLLALGPFVDYLCAALDLEF
ncbi:MAG TPA: DUF2461 domain-containing protein [Luteimonas sp.]|nr:DUF2461 domain-containing protein [Luteimonas sp.]